LRRHPGAERGPAKAGGQVQILLELLDEAFAKKSWHGTNLKGSVRGLDPALAAWRAAPGRHNIRELVVHAAYWKHAVWRRLAGEKRGTFSLQGSNWFARQDRADPKGWAADIALLTAEHKRLRDAVARLTPAELRQVPKGSRFTVAGLVRGAAAHDLYHAGQIQLLKRLGPARSP
jgi:DinB superfamily